jgi:hypothetical protein
MTGFPREYIVENNARSQEARAIDQAEFAQFPLTHPRKAVHVTILGHFDALIYGELVRCQLLKLNWIKDPRYISLFRN